MFIIIMSSEYEMCVTKVPPSILRKVNFPPSVMGIHSLIATVVIITFIKTVNS